MKQFLSAERILQLSCLIVIFWAFWFWQGPSKRPLPNTDFPQMPKLQIEKITDQAFVEKIKSNLEALRQPVTLFTEVMIKEMRNIFRPPNKTVVKSEKICEECGGINKGDAAICIHCGALFPRDDLDDDSDGMPNYWEIQYEFDSEDPSDAAKDADGDGINNLEEFLNGTDPRVKNDGVVVSDLPFTLVNTYKKPIQILFMGYLKKLDGTFELQVNWAGKTEFYKMGDVVRGYTVKEFKKDIIRVENKVTGVPTFQDRSFIVCQRKKFEEKRFFKNKLVTENEDFAKVKFLDSEKSLEIYIGYLIEDPVSGKTFTVTDIGLRPPKIKVVDEFQKDYTLKLRR